MRTNRSGSATRARTSHRTRRLPLAEIAALLLTAVAMGCSSVQLEVYRRPRHDFRAYETIAILPLSPPGKEPEDKEAVQVVTALLGAKMVKEKYDIIDADSAVARLNAADPALGRADGGSDVAVLRKAAEILGVKAILTGELEFYGPFDFHVPASQVPYLYDDWYGYPRRGYYYEPGYTETGSEAKLKLKLFDADLGAYVWWAEGDRVGSERIAQRYAKEIISKAFEKFPVKPPGEKKHKKEDDKASLPEKDRATKP